MRLFKNDKIAVIGTILTTVTGGLSSIGILGLFSEYSGGSVASALLTLRTKTQNWPWLSNQFFIVATLDLSLLMLGLGLIFSYLQGRRPDKLTNLILGSVILASTFFTHSVLSLIILVITLLIFSLWNFKYKGRVIVSFVSILLAILAFNLLSYNFFTNILLNYYLTYFVFFDGSSLFPYNTIVLGAIALLILTLVMLWFLAPRISVVIRNKLEFSKDCRLFSTKFVSSLCAVIALLIFVVSLTLIVINFNTLNLPDETVFPWYIYALRLAPLLQLTLLSVPIALKKVYQEASAGYLLMMSWVISGVIVAELSVVFPNLVAPLIANRVLMSTYFPLGALGALTLVSLIKTKLPQVRLRIRSSFHRINVKKTAIYFLMIMLALSFLSYAYSTEFFYQKNMIGQVSNDQKNLYKYLETLPAEKVLLTYSSSSYESFSSHTLHKTYSYYQYGTFVTWPIEILFETSSVVVANYFLYKLGITDIVLTKQDLIALENTSNGTLLSMLSFFPIVFNNSIATVYSVPNFLLSDSSNYELIEPIVTPNFDSTLESPIHVPISLENFRITGGPNSFNIQNGTIIQWIENITAPKAQYLQLYKGIDIPTALSPTASFKIKGTGNALFNVGFYDENIKEWVWYSNEKGLPDHFFNSSTEWTTVEVDLSSILGKSASIQYIDFLVTSADGSPVTVEWSDFDIFLKLDTTELVSNTYNLAYNSLAINEVPFTIGEVNNSFKLNPNTVYVFSSSFSNCFSINDLIGNVTAGANAVFFFNSLISGKEDLALIHSLGMELNGLVSAKSAFIDQGNINFPFDLSTTNLTIQNSLYTNNISSYYKTPDNDTVPLIITFAVGNGTVMLVNLPTSLDLNRIFADIPINAVKSIIKVLPTFSTSNILKTLPYPEDLFKLGNPDVVNIYNMKGLEDYIYAFSDIKLEGNISISSDYVVFEQTRLFVKELQVQNTTNRETIDNITILNPQIHGWHNTTLTSQDATIYGIGNEMPYIETSTLSSLTIYVDTSGVNLTVEQNGELKNLTLSNVSLKMLFDGNLTTSLTMQKPIITLNPGSLNASWEGVFWFKGQMFTTVSLPEDWEIKGILRLEIVQSNSVILTKLQYKDDISVVI